MPANVVQLRAGPVGNLVLGQYGGGDLLLHPSVGGEAGAHLGQIGRVLPVGDQGGAHQAGGAVQPRHLQQRLGRQRAPGLGDLQKAGYVAEIAHGRTAHIGPYGIGFFGLGLEQSRLLQAGGGLQGQGQLLARLGQGQLGEHLPYLGKFQHPQVAFIHGHMTTPSAYGVHGALGPRPGPLFRLPASWASRILLLHAPEIVPGGGGQVLDSVPMGAL